MLVQEQFSSTLWTIAILITFPCVFCSEMEVDTTYGTIRGTILDDAIGFLGVPYAEPPVGELRWKDPVSPNSWAPSIYPADVLSPGCPQICLVPSTGCPEQMSEDCLYLNIYAPIAPRVSGLLPVMVFLHGGGFESSSASALLHDGRFLAGQTDTIVVTLNYRIGALGFLHVKDELEGNFGLKDQLLALQFVHENIMNFGGDPLKVTLAGQSAGAESAALHLVDPEAAKLFSQVILFSNPFALPMKTSPDATKLGNVFLSKVKCKGESDIQNCLKGKSIDEILAAEEKARSANVNDEEIFQIFQPWGPVVAKQTVDRIRTETFTAKPLMLGSLTEDARFFVFEAFSDPIWSLEYLLEISIIIPDYSSQVLERYPERDLFDDHREVLSELGTDYMFLCSNLNVAKNYSKKRQAPVYHYVMDQVVSVYEGWEEFSWCYGHVCHGGDLPYIFRTFPLAGYSYTQAEQNMMDGLTSYLANFFHNGDPNQSYHLAGALRQQAIPTWNRIDEMNGYWATMTLSGSNGNHITLDYEADTCFFWDDIGYSGVSYIN